MRREPDESNETANALVVVEDVDDINATDDTAIVAMMTGQAIEDYVYAFKQGGKMVEGLTLAGINEAANRRGGISVEDVQFEDREHSWLAIVKATDTFTGNSRYGAYEQPKKSGNREDPHAFIKVVHKAQRNAIKQLIPTPVIKEIIDFYRGRTKQPAVAQTAATAEPTDVQTDSGEAITTQQKAAFSIAQKMRDALDRRNVSQRDFWNFVRRRFNVQSRNEMREDQWAKLAAELQAATASKDVFDDFVTDIQRVLQAQQDTGGQSESDNTDLHIDSERMDEPKAKPAPKATGGKRGSEKPPQKTPKKDDLF
ncbi:MAG: hypothetical protein O3A46_05495 [Candidatus Poribacteria bacterium]|nr:hypothetical protein [Candidatus Poribacteria bacterium]